jgi:hypothetical protein
MKRTAYPFSYSSIVLIVTFFVIHSLSVNAQLTTIPSGSFVVNMGGTPVSPQTVANGLKPWGLVYDLLKNEKIPVLWVINPGKPKDGIDFTYNGIDYKGGPFIITAGYRTAAVNAKIASWQAMGVVGVTTTSAITVPVYTTFHSAPRWTLDKNNGGIAVSFFTKAGIPPGAYGGSSSSAWKLPSQLTCCDDIFVMPHADPIWSTHSNLYNWNLSCKGYIWLGCHAGSALEDMFNPAMPGQQTNFLCEKTGTASGAGPYFENALLLWGNHDDGTLPYSYDYHDDPVMQFMGILDAATQNGSEQIYLPMSAGWYSSTKVGVYDPDHPDRYQPYVSPKHRAAILAYGDAYGDPNRGKVMLEASHNIGGSTTPPYIAAMRAFFNFSFLKSSEDPAIPTFTLPDTVYSSSPTTLTYTVPGGTGSYTNTWSSSCGGTFSPNANQPTVTYTPPTVNGPTTCVITVSITDNCGRTFFNSEPVVIMPCTITTIVTINSPLCNGNQNGSISIALSGGASPYTWTWSGTSSGSGGPSASPLIISNLGAGTYAIAILSPSSGCSTTLNVQVTQPNVLSASTTTTNALCFGGGGSIDLSVSGGTTPYTYSWSDLPGSPDPEDRANISAGTYTVTVTDVKGCTTTATAVITQPASQLNVAGTIVNVNCYGNINGSINITASGGTSPYTYDWADISGTTNIEDRTILAPGSYQVQVKDANQCLVSQTFIVTQPAALVITGVVVNPTCPSNAQQLSNNGSIDLSVAGGTAPFTYSWTASAGGIIPSGQATGQDLTLLIEGTYSIVVTDANGCTKQGSFTLNGINPNPSQPTTIGQ